MCKVNKKLPLSDTGIFKIYQYPKHTNFITHTSIKKNNLTK